MNNSIKFHYEFIDDYRCGPYVNINRLDNLDDPEHNKYCETCFDVISNTDTLNYSLILIEIWDDIIMTLEFNTKENAIDSLIKIYSQVNNFLPFKKTGMTGAFKDIGDYPDISDNNDIKNIPDINLSNIDKRSYYFGIVFNNKTKYIEYDLVISPPS